MLEIKTDLLTPQSLTASKNGGLAPVSVENLKGRGHVLLSAKSSAGSSPTLAVKLQGSPPLSRGPEMIGEGEIEIEHRTGTDTAIRLAAAFTLTEGASISNVTLPLKANAAGITGDLTLSIMTDDGGDPDETPLGSVTVDAATVAVDEFGNVEFEFANPVDLEDGDYWLVLSSDVTLSATDNISWRASTVASGGNASVFDDAWAADATKDLDFWADVYSFADLTGGAFTGVTTTGSLQMKGLNFDELAVIRPHVTVGGTSSPAFYTSLALIGRQEYP